MKCLDTYHISNGVYTPASAGDARAVRGFVCPIFHGSPSAGAALNAKRLRTSRRLRSENEAPGARWDLYGDRRVVVAQIVQKLLDGSRAVDGRDRRANEDGCVGVR